MTWGVCPRCGDRFYGKFLWDHECDSSDVGAVRRLSDRMFATLEGAAHDHGVVACLDTAVRVLLDANPSITPCEALTAIGGVLATMLASEERKEREREECPF